MVLAFYTTKIKHLSNYDYYITTQQQQTLPELRQAPAMLDQQINVRLKNYNAMKIRETTDKQHTKIQFS